MESQSGVTPTPKLIFNTGPLPKYGYATFIPNREGLRITVRIPFPTDPADWELNRMKEYFLTEGLRAIREAAELKWQWDGKEVQGRPMFFIPYMEVVANSPAEEKMPGDSSAKLMPSLTFVPKSASDGKSGTTESDSKQGTKREPEKENHITIDIADIKKDEHVLVYKDQKRDLMVYEERGTDAMQPASKSEYQPTHQ